MPQNLNARKQQTIVSAIKRVALGRMASSRAAPPTVSKADRERAWPRTTLLILAVASLQGCIGVHGMAKDETSASEVNVELQQPNKDWSVNGDGLVETEGSYFTGTYRNVFAELGKSQAEIDHKLERAYSTYFSANDENRLYYEFSADEGYVKDIAHDDIRSEGQSYAMMIALQRNDQAMFNKLWRFAHTRMRIHDPNHPNYRGYAWALNTGGEICDENSAPDGEEYFAMALYFAHHRWGSASSTTVDNYKHWADDLVDMMKNRPSISGPRARRVVNSEGAACLGKKIVDEVTSVPLFDPVQKQILFNATKGEEFTDPSYHLPAFYNLIALWGPTQDAAFWNDAAATSRSFLARAMHAETGLAAEYSNFDGSPHRVSWNNNSGKFAYDAWRVGGNVGMDWAWMMQPNTELRSRADALLRFFHGQGASEYLSIFNIDGSKGTGHHSPGLVAMNAVATLAATDAAAAESTTILHDFWNTQLPTGKYRYYDGLLYMFGLLHLSGQYKIYAPQAVEQAPDATEQAEDEAETASSSPI